MKAAQGATIAAALVLSAALVASVPPPQYVIVPAPAGPVSGPTGYGATNARAERRANERAAARRARRSNRGATA